MPGFVHLHVHSSYSLLEGALTIARLAEARQGRPAAGAGAHRHRQPVRRARILREARRRRASSRSSAARWRSISATRKRSRVRGRRAQCDRPRIVLLAARESGYRSLMRLASPRLSRHAAERAAASAARLARRRDRRADRADRRARRAARCGDRRRAGPSRRKPAARRWSGCSAIGSMSRSSATASTPSARSSRSSSTLADAHAACRWSRPTSRFFADARTTRRMTRCSASPKGAWSPRPTGASSRPSTGSRPARKWRSCSPICPRRVAAASRSPALRVPAATREADPAALFGRRTAPRSTRRPNCAGSAEGARAPPRGARPRPRPQRRGLSRAPRLRARRHRSA